MQRTGKKSPAEAGPRALAEGVPQRDNSERGGWFQKEKPRRMTGLKMSCMGPHKGHSIQAPRSTFVCQHVRIGAAAGRGDNRDCAPMPTRRHYRRPNPDRRRALELLAASHHGYSKAILRAHGFSMDMMVELVKAGLATTKRERIVAGGRQTDVVRVRITEAGRQALAKMSK
jgi:hypothetical protein